MGFPTHKIEIGEHKRSMYSLQIRDLIEDLDHIDLRPSYQRDEVWSRTDKRLLIDSILKGYDIPKFYTRSIDQVKDGRIIKKEVLDGQQRTATIRDFKLNRFSLAQRSVIDGIDVSRKKYRDLPESLKKRLDKYEFHFVEYENISDSACREMFRRMQHGKALTAVEKRNSYGGEMAEFVNEISQCEFIKNSEIRRTRSKHKKIAESMIALEKHRIETGEFGCDLKPNNLENLYKHDFDINGELANAVRRIVRALSKKFRTNLKGIKKDNQAITLYCIFSELHESIGEEFSEKYFKFEVRVDTVRAKPLEDRPHDLDSYISRIKSSSDRKDSIQYRVNIVKKYVLEGF